MEVAPTAHHIMGGAIIDTDCTTTLDSLYACGEVVGGIHGGNRIGGNAIAEGQVFGFIAGNSAAAAAAKIKRNGTDLLPLAKELESKRNEKLKGGNGEVKPSTIKKKLQQIMMAKAGVIRDEVGLKEAQEDLDKLSEELSRSGAGNSKLPFNQQAVDHFEASNMVEFSKLVVAAALMRKESRGAHYRKDFPNRDDQGFMQNIFIKGDKLWAEKKWN